MKYPSTPIPARLLYRRNRFLGCVDLAGKRVECFIPNPGRMHELMVPGARVYLCHRSGENRKTGYDLTMVQLGETLVSIDSRLPNQLLMEAITGGKLPEFRGYHVERTEPRLRDSRLDLLLCRGAEQMLVEVKSCTLVEEGVAYFPDAPTRRGARHMKVLSEAREKGRAAVCFIIQRDDALVWSPNKEMDPRFTENLRAAVDNGVEVYAYICSVTLDGVEILRRVPVSLG